VFWHVGIITNNPDLHFEFSLFLLLAEGGIFYARIEVYKMPLPDFRANVDFSKSSLSGKGIPVERSDKTGTAKLSMVLR